MAGVALCTCGWFERRSTMRLAAVVALLHLIDMHWDDTELCEALVARPHDE